MSSVDHPTIYDITTDQLDALLAQRRERRLLAWEVYEKAVESKKRATDERLRAALTKQIAMLTKDFERADKALDKLDARINKINGIRVELEDYV